ncbi:IDEAL domain-containing protein [Enterococcus alcedinis]|uniref:IDEAL domain-containing protein n=1 Tax=Enterococcus alcedinis TaxID=1274384 RepID=UPI00361FDBC6
MEKPLYLECIFPESWDNPLYVAVLEDNRFHKWNDHLDEVMVDRVDAYFKQNALENKIQQLYQEIDQALEQGNQEQFLLLTNQVNELLLQKEVLQ